MPSSKKSVTLGQLRVGIFVLVAVVILVFLVLNASGDINPFSKKLHLRARFVDANGLREGSEVRLAGVRVGKVDRIALLAPSDVPNAPRVEAVMTIDSTIDGQPANQRIRSDSTAQQASPSLLGNEMLINITPGTAVGSPVSENAILPSSSSNTVNDFATSGTDLAQRLSKLSDEISGIVRDVKDGKGTVGRLFSDEALYNNLNATIRETEDVMTQVRSGNGSAGRFINDPALYNNANDIAVQLRAIAADLRAGRGTAGKLLTDDEFYTRINRTADKLDRSVDQVNLMITDINTGHGTLGKLIKDEQVYNDARAAIARFNTTAERIDNLVAAAQRGEGTVGKLLTDDALYTNVNQLSSEGVKMIYDFRQNPKKYLTIKFELF
ncbi:MAG TPA: MlaD family protein [Pyrinomonadaceae bacterium]|jgi:ABC-type transport system involved in resistance to organic solvents, periplasmic component|nr:MlaD family protein [Pyrinomonadaceae bacterium]